MAFKALTVNTPPEQAAHILAEDDAALYGGVLGGDCVLDIGGKMASSVITNNKVRITDGVVLVGGHVGRILKGDYEDMTITNGISGKKRNDLIVARFIAGSSGGSDTFSLVVVQGASGTTATDPTTVRGDLYSGDKQRDYPLWRVKVENLSIVKVEQLYEVCSSNKNLLAKYNDLTTKYNALNTNIANKIIVGSTKNAMLVLTQPTLTFAAGVATYNATETANTYGKSVLGATAQLKSGSGVVITSTAIAGSTVTIRCANLSGTPFVGSIAVAMQLFLG